MWFCSMNRVNNSKEMLPKRFEKTYVKKGFWEDAKKNSTKKYGVAKYSKNCLEINGG